MTSKTPKTPGQNADRNRKIAETALMGVVAACLFSNPAFAAAGDPGAVLQGAIDMLTGGWARGLAVLAVIGIGLSALGGRFNIVGAVTVCAGIAIIFSAAWIADKLGAVAG